VPATPAPAITSLVRSETDDEKAQLGRTGRDPHWNPTGLGLGNETFVTASNESAANGTSLTELRRRLEERLDSKRIDL